MAAEKFDFGEFLAVLEAKRAALDALIGSYRAALSLGALGQPGEVDMASVGGGSGSRHGAAGRSRPQGAFLSKSLPAADPDLPLGRTAQADDQGDRDRAERGRGGIDGPELRQHRHDGPSSAKDGRDVVMKFNDGWALSEFYPREPSEPDRRPKRTEGGGEENG